VNAWSFNAPSIERRANHADICDCAILPSIIVVAETVVGATTGVVAAPKGYFKAMKEVCDKYGALLILDEVSGERHNYTQVEVDQTNR
jgi:acetylornithine/succinyldiaminopimelate/putrescine aminotransferase